MPRLPVPGSDSGQWGDILNAFLLVEHNSDGTLKTPSIPSTDKGAVGGVAELDGGGKVPTSQLPAAALASDATSTDKGILRLTGDLGGTADSPTVPELSNKEDTSNKSTNTSLGTSNTLYPTQNAVKTYVDTQNGNYVPLSGGTMTGGLNLTTDASTGIALYNTADTTTNYERLRLDWASNVATISAERGGSGNARNLVLSTLTNVLTFSETGSSAFTMQRNTTAIASLVSITSTSLQASSGSQSGLNINPTINQSGTGSYSMLTINPSITTTGSTTNYLIDAQVGSSPRFQVRGDSGATIHTLVSAPNGSGDVVLGIQNNATTANETASLNFYTTTNTASPFARIRTTRVDGANSRLSLGPMTTSAIVDHIQMYGDTGYMSIGAGSTPANGLMTLGTNTTAATGGLWFGTDVNLYRSAADTLKTDDNFIVAAAGTVANSVTTIDATQTLTSKRITPRVTSITSSATPTINTDNCDAVTITALATNITSMTSGLSGTPTDFQKLLIRLKDNGVARSITWGASFASRGVTLPTTTVISKVLTVGLIYNSVTNTWDCLAVAQET